MAMDPKVRNLIIFLITNLGGVVLAFFLFVKFSGVKDYIWLLGFITLLVAVWRIGLSVYRRLILPAKKPLEFGKWAIVTGNNVILFLQLIMIVIFVRIHVWYWKRVC